jgi:hypothetical protein
LPDAPSPRYEVPSVRRFTEHDRDMRLQSPIMETVIGSAGRLAEGRSG